MPLADAPWVISSTLPHRPHDPVDENGPPPISCLAAGDGCAWPWRDARDRSHLPQDVRDLSAGPRTCKGRGILLTQRLDACDIERATGDQLHRGGAQLLTAGSLHRQPLYRRGHVCKSGPWPCLPSDQRRHARPAVPGRGGAIFALQMSSRRLAHGGRCRGVAPARQEYGRHRAGRHPLKGRSPCSPRNELRLLDAVHPAGSPGHSVTATG